MRERKMCGLWQSSPEKTLEERVARLNEQLNYRETLTDAMRQVGVVCGYRPQTRETLIEAFRAELPPCEDLEAGAATRRLFDWIVIHMDEVLSTMVERGRLTIQLGMFRTVKEVEHCSSDSVLATEILEDEVASNDVATCVICLQRKKQLASKECGHLLFCFSCAREMITKYGTDIKCPLCMRPIVCKMLRVFN